MTTATAIEPVKKEKTVFDLIESKKGDFAKALPSIITPERFVRIALTVIRTNDKLQKCTPVSLIASLMKAAQVGVMPDNSRAYLVPYKDEATFILGYRGMIELALRSGLVSKIVAQVVFENDEFNFEFGLAETLRHVPAKGDRGTMTYAYAYALMKDGSNAFDVMSKGDIDKIRKRSKAANNGPWVTDFEEMARKTVVRRLAKYLPQAEDLIEAMTQDDDFEDEVKRPEPVISHIDLSSLKSGNPETHEGHDSKNAPKPSAEIAGEGDDVPLGSSPLDPSLTDEMISQFEDVKSAMEEAPSFAALMDLYAKWQEIKGGYPAVMSDEISRIYAERQAHFQAAERTAEAGAKNRKLKF